MKHYFKTLFCIIIMILSCTVIDAQRPNRPQNDKQQRLSREQLAEVQAKHIAHELAFSDAITQKFIKTYCNSQKEIWALGPRPRKDIQGQSEQENESRIRQRFAMSEKILNIRQKYYKEYSQFLTQTQIERVYEEERKMIKRITQRVQGQRRPAPRVNK